MTTGPLDGAVLDLAPFELLASVIDLGSLSAAAARHGVSQPAVSARMRTLERQLGLPLLVRSPTGSRATAEGMVVARAAASVLREAQLLAKAAADLRALHQGSVRIAASLIIAEHLLPRWLAALAEAGTPASVELRVENAQRVAELVESGQVDLGFSEAGVAPAGLDAEVVDADELLVVCAPSHPWAARRAIHPAELATARLVLREQGSGGRDLLERRLAELQLRPSEPAAEIASPGALAAAVAAGVAPGVVSRWAVEADVEVGRLRRVDVVGLDLSRDLLAVWRHGERPALLERLLGLVAPRSPTAPATPRTM
jgi:DNA-binding transcriptional LysR family regulator